MRTHPKLLLLIDFEEDAEGREKERKERETS